MQVSTISVRVSEKINVGNYESLEPTVEAVAHLDPGEQTDAAYDQLREITQQLWVKETISRLKVLIERRKQTDTEGVPLARALLDAYGKQLR